MNYTALNIPCTEDLSEILTAELGDYPFESFLWEDGTLKSYIQTSNLEELDKKELSALMARYNVKGTYEEIPTENWNAQWEEHDFTPVDVDGRLRIRAPHHKPASEGECEVVLRPRMSFGSGHHATTWMMSRETMDLRVEGRTGLDIGCGTGVLAIVAAKCGARHTDAVDIDDVCVESCRENIALNGVEERITPILGDISVVGDRHYDFILANIHRNILINQMEISARLLSEGGDLLMSGFLEEDVPAILASAAECGLQHIATRSREGWQLVHVRK